MSNPTEPFWRQPTQQTTAYTHPPKPDRRHQIEALITRTRNTYDAIWDLMPAIAAFALLLWLTTFVPHQ